jgi:uncharacterized protein (DUF885 family)
VTDAAPHFSAWLDRFFISYYAHRPVNATFIGQHAWDHALPDYSEAGIGRVLDEMQRLAADLTTLPQEPLTPAQALDRQLAQGFLQIQDWEYRANFFQSGNPSLYTGEAIFGLIALFLTPFAPRREQTAAAIARMHAIPAFLAQAEANLTTAPPAWTARARRECQGALAFLTVGVEALIAEDAYAAAELRTAAALAAAAFRRYDAFLADTLAQQPRPDVAAGEAALDLYLRQGHFLTESADDLAARAEAELGRAQVELESHAADFGCATPEQALAQLDDLHPSAAAYYASFPQVWEAARAAAVAHDLVTWPDFPIRYQPQPQWARACAPFLYFLFYRAPAAYNRPSPHPYLVSPLPADADPIALEKFLRANNDSVIKLNHVVHHGSLGHHVQNWHASRAASRFGQVAAVDTASRIAMFCGGTMAEGWAVYATDLMAEIGFLTPLEAYAEHQSWRRMSARCVVDVRLHQGRMSLDEAARFYQERAGMSAAAAQGEAVKNSMFPGAAVIYLAGCTRIHALRRTLAAQQGAAFNLGRFHDRFLSFGSVPVELIAQAMEKENRHVTPSA